MQPRFREDKATQAAALLLGSAGGSMNYMELIKLLYLADRATLDRRGRPITFARAVSMKHGPVLSEVLDPVNEGSPPAARPLWNRAISIPSNHQVRLTGGVFARLPDDLSDTEEDVLAEVFREYGLDPWPLVDMLHDTVPEWIPTNGAIQIQYRDILLNDSWSEAEAAEVESELESVAMMDRLVAV
jgi:uncharacterized phage-associated protein